jgi:hypothetical protein
MSTVPKVDKLMKVADGDSTVFPTRRVRELRQLNKTWEVIFLFLVDVNGF